ncbi:MAG TPA: hypothetical protein VIK18_08585 [Pirellulales bacterium]
MPQLLAWYRQLYDVDLNNQSAALSVFLGGGRVPIDNLTIRPRGRPKKTS